MEDLFYKDNTKLCGTLQDGVFFPCTTLIPEWLKKSVEKSLKFNLLNTEMGHGKENP
ncbi:hypothetical protein C810_01410 [Lachnospiraceae bacterium A2]|nr:hypothetical protein C810_01410 [Lachnospiraceae bacterium A2]